ncbi:MAG: hypothetical protein M1825_002550 [Sarcosagium campestre]|nr:MAG: hypothetical protein M1825_002550 [Sarcosagium campestre]
MGSGQSKSPAGASQHVFTSEAPIGFSQSLIESLRDTPESDSTRQKSQELTIQKRVQEELKRLQAQDSQRLKDIEEKIASEASDTRTAVQGQGHDAEAAGNKFRELSRDSIQEEIKNLRQRLEGRKKLESLDKEVEKARDAVTHCLRLNDRRPLDCWKEVDDFKREVAKLEKSFVEKTLQ